MGDFQPYDWYWQDEDGRIYGSAENKIVTEGDERFQSWLANGNPARAWPRNADGEQTTDAMQEVLTPYSIFLVLGALKNHLKIEVDGQAEDERLNYITPGAGQAMTYQQKVDEARAVKAATAPLAADFPVLASEIGITAETLSDVADTVLAAFSQWQQIGAMIESIRLGAKRDIDAAEDEAAARAIVEAIVWPSAQVQA